MQFASEKYIFTHLQIHMHIPTCMPTCKYLYIYTHTRAHILIYVYTHTLIYAYILTHTIVGAGSPRLWICRSLAVLPFMSATASRPASVLRDYLCIPGFSIPLLCCHPVRVCRCHWRGATVTHIVIAYVSRPIIPAVCAVCFGPISHSSPAFMHCKTHCISAPPKNPRFSYSFLLFPASFYSKQ